MGYDPCECAICYLDYGCNELAMNESTRAHICGICMQKKIDDSRSSVTYYMKEWIDHFGAKKCGFCDNPGSMFLVPVCEKHKV